jgi:hypothetical protein
MIQAILRETRGRQKRERESGAQKSSADTSFSFTLSSLCFPSLFPLSSLESLLDNHGFFAYNAAVSVLLKYFFILRLRCYRAWRRLFRAPAAPPPALVKRGQDAPLPFLEGANLPWLSYGNDFGANAWSPAGGLASPGKQEDLRRHLRALRERGARVVRWFLFCDGRAGIRFSRAGTPLGPDERLFSDIDCALEAVVREEMQVVFVLFDFLWFDSASMFNGVQTGGRSRVITNTYKQLALRRRVLAPLLKRYGRSAAILAWDIINEPEWATRGWGGGSIGPAVSFPAMRRFIRRVARLVHRHSDHLATVGLGNAAGLPLVRGCGLDFYQVHWYDRWDSVAPLEQPVAELGLDRPLLLGEFPTRNSSRSPEAIVAASRLSGYCGALSWSLLAKDKFSGMQGIST